VFVTSTPPQRGTTVNGPLPDLVYATPYDSSGYATAARRYLRALWKLQHPTAWLPLTVQYDGWLPKERPADGPPELMRLPGDATPDPILLAHCIPHGWAKIGAHRAHRRFIGQTVWEADPIPTRWHHELQAADEIWVPTRWNADVFTASGVTAPVHVVPHIIDESQPGDPPLDLPDDRFVFLTIGTWDWRKRPDLLLHAYLRAFTADDPVLLVIKTGRRILSWTTANETERQTWYQLMQVVRQYRNPAEVMLVTEELTDQQMSGLLRQADCFASLTCVEGWGLGAFDAAAAGVPVIITGYGGQMEWLGHDHPGAVPFTMAAADHQDRTMFEPGMTWAIADVDVAADMMRSVISSSSPIRAAATPLARRLSDTYSEQTIGQLMKALLA